jgi:four helix bundle suffix protein
MNSHGKDGKKGRNESAGSERRASWDAPAPDPGSERILPPRGDYERLLSFQKAEVVYDITFRFAHKYLARSDRTIDQMIQSARSGKKNILEGSKAGRASKETEIKLTNVARSSLEELLDDYKDYLRARDLPIWDKDSREALYVRQLGRRTPQTYELYRKFVDTRPPEIIANIAICLIHQTNYLIDQQLLRLEKDFLEQGGLRERMTRARIAHRNAKPNKPSTNAPNSNTSPDSRDSNTSPAPGGSHNSHNSHDSHPRKSGPAGGQR